MRSYVSEVKVYKRGKWRQYLITLKKGHEFKENEKVIIFSEVEIDVYKNELELRNTIIRNKENEIKELEQEKVQLIKRLEERSDLLIETQQKVEKSLVGITKLMGMLNRLTNRSLIDRITNKIPQDIKDIQTQKPTLIIETPPQDPKSK